MNLAKRIGPALQPSDALDIHHVLHVPNGLHDSLELLEVHHLDDEVVEALAVVGDRDSALMMLPCLEEIAAVISARTPGRSRPM